MARFKKRFVSPTGELRSVVIKGEGIEKRGKQIFTATVLVKKDSPEWKQVLKDAEAAWEEARAANGTKGSLGLSTEYNPKCKTASIKPHNVRDPEGTIDPETEEVAWVPTEYMAIRAKTNTTWKNGDPKVVKLKSANGTDLTDDYAKQSWSIGNESKGRIYCTWDYSNYEDTPRITLYLDAVQLTKLEKYVGGDVEVDEIEGDEIDMSIPAEYEEEEVEGV